jgi:hypothetical protein
VLVDAEGTPRARCRCGNPLLPPQTLSGEVTYTGTPWDGFDAAALVAPPGTATTPVTPTPDGTAVPSGSPATAEPPVDEGSNLIVDGGFEGPLASPWGTGIYEPREEVFWGSAVAGAAIDPTESAAGNSSLLITNESESAPQVYRTMSQRVAVDPSLPHCLVVWARTHPESVNGILSVAVDDAWTVRLNIPASATSWQPHLLEFTPEDGDVDVRLITEAPGAVWIDQLGLYPGPCSG